MSREPVVVMRACEDVQAMSDDLIPWRKGNNWKV